MKTLAATLLLSSLLFGAPVLAGSGHDHDHDHDHGHSHSHVQAPVSKEIAEKNANDVISSLVKRDKIDKSWSTIKAMSVENKILNGLSEWVVIYHNEKISDPEKKKLYVFLTIGGEYVAANYTGN